MHNCIQRVNVELSNPKLNGEKDVGHFDPFQLESLETKHRLRSPLFYHSTHPLLFAVPVALDELISQPFISLF